MSDVLVTAPPAVITVPRDLSRYGAQKVEMTDADRAEMMRSELALATRELAELRNTIRCFASMLEMLVLMNRRGEWPLTVDEEGTLLIPRLPLELMRERGGSISVANHPEGFLVRFRDRLYNPQTEAL